MDYSACQPGVRVAMPEQRSDRDTSPVSHTEPWEITEYRVVRPGDYYIGLEVKGVVYAHANDECVFRNYMRAIVRSLRPYNSPHDVLAAYDNA